MFKKISLILLGLFYIAAGLNHFINPEFYLDLIPPYFPQPEVINFASGLVEIILGIAVFIPKSRTLASYGIIALLIALIPAHIYMIQKGGCMGDQLCVDEWIMWIRLFPMQFLLMYWAWWHRS